MFKFRQVQTKQVWSRLVEGLGKKLHSQKKCLLYECYLNQRANACALVNAWQIA